MTTDIILVAHALTQWNVDGRIQGHTDIPLNSTGQNMAERLAERLANEKIAAIYASDLQRALQTAEPAARRMDLPVLSDVRLREGRSIHQETSHRYPTLSFSQEIETEEDVRRRMLAMLSETAQTHDGDTILAVSHMGAIRIFISHVLSLDHNQKTLPYKGKRTALNRLQYADGCWTCLALDDDLHLKGTDTASIHANHG